MNGREIIKAIMEQRGISNIEYAKELGITRAAIWDRLDTQKSRKDIPVSTLSSMAKVLGYKVVIVPMGVKIKSGYVVDN